MTTLLFHYFRKKALAVFLTTAAILGQLHLAAQNCTPPAASSQCTPPTSWNVDKMVNGTQDFKSLTGVNPDEVTQKIRLTGSGTVIVNGDDLLLKSGGAVVYVNGPTLIINNGNLKTDAAGSRFIMTNGTLRTHGNFQQVPNSVVCISNSTVDIGEEQAGVNFTSQTSTSANFQNDGGYRYLNTVCMNVTHDFQLQSTGSGSGINGVDVIINSCIEVGDRGSNHATPSAFGYSDGDDSGNWQNNNTQSIYGTDIVVANGDYQNSIGVMTLCDVDIKVNKSGNFQNNSGSIVGQDVCVAVEDVFENSATWTATQVQWYSKKQNSTNVPGAGGESLQSTVLECFVQCCSPGTPPDPQCPVPVVTINSSQGANNTTVCGDEAIVFTTDEPDCSEVTLTWNFGAGANPQTATGKGPHYVTYSAPGTATVTLKADNNCDGGVGTTVCPPPPPPPIGSNCCESNSGKPKKITVKYTGASCSETNTSQDAGKYDCDNFSGGPNNDPSVYIKVTENSDGSGKLYFSGNVAINASFTPNAGNAGDNEFKSKVFFNIYSSQGGTLLQRVNMHTSCSAPLVPGENIGSILLESAEWSNGNFCDISGGGSGGSGSGGADCCDQGDKPNSLTIQYNGESCSNTSTSQSSGKYSCADVGSGPNGDTNVYIKVAEKADGSGDQYFAGNVAIGGTFTAASANAGEDDFNSNTWFLVYSSQGGTLLQKVSIHTSCSAPIVAGDQFGSLILQSATFKNGVSCGPTTPPGPNCLDCEETVSIPITIIDCDCISQGGDDDGDGVCDNQDCEPNDPNLPTTPGTPCNDGNPNTVSDVIQNDGCSCAGTPLQCNVDIIISQKICDGKGTVSTADDTYTFVVQATGFDTGASWTGSYSNAYLGAFAFGPNAYGSSVVLGPFPAGQFTSSNTSPPITVQNGLDIDVFISDSQNSGCTDAVTVTSTGPCSPPPVCENITNGGTIGFGQNCLSSTSIACNTAAPNITNCASPSGGSGALEIIWLKSTSSCSAPTTTADDIIAGLDPHWVLVPGQTGLTLNPGIVNANTCYLRCTRRAGCSSYVESNIISLTTDCGGGPDCVNGINITTGNGTITVTGLDGSPVSSLQVFNSSWGTEFSCFANCGASKTLNVAAGTYYVYAKYYTANYQFICEKKETVTVGGGGPCANAGGDSDGDGVCNNDDCQPNNPAYPATPGTACNDGNPNTSNDVVTANGCGCAGTTTNPCANAGGDSDGDGVCNNQDCQPNNPAYPATPGTACNDGNANTTNDVVQADGCSCAGTPVGGGPDCDNDINITTGNGTITVTGLGGAPISSLQVFNSSWGTEFSCFANCGASKTLNVAAGTYYVYAKYYTANYQLICEKQATITVTGGNPCANAGGDSDGDGVCNNDDCQPNNPAYPATPGSACNDGNPNTENDVVTANGCGCAGTPVNTGCTPKEIVRYDMNACHSCSSGSNADWSEFAAAIISNSGCQSVTATGLSPSNNSDPHSCTPGASGNSMCVGQGTTVQFSVTLNGSGNNKLTGISFYEQAPHTYLWETAGCGSPVSGSNNRPTKFDLKVYKGGSLVYSKTMTTQTSWNLRTIDFTSDPDFDVNGSATYTFKFTPYNATGSGSVKAWDLDEIKVMGCCSGNVDPCANAGGDSDGDGVCNNQDCAPGDASLPAAPGTACNDGNANTSNDVIQNDGCTCAGTTSGGGIDCNNINITTGPGKIIVSNLDGAPVSSVQVFSSNWTQTFFTCFGDCNATQNISLAAGSYIVLAKYYNSSWQPQCETMKTVNVTNNLIANDQFDFEVAKQEEHVELFWIHNNGNKVSDYVLERSINGNDFEAIYSESSKGTTSMEVYQGFDINPVTGDNFYRVRMDMLNGTTQYSEVKTVHFADLIDFTIFPNPANDFTKVNLETVVGKKDVTITVYNNLGVTMKQFELDEVYSKYHQLDLRELKEGHYIVWLNVPGHKPLAKQLMIGKL